MIDPQLTGKRILITGSSSGLGFAMAKALGTHGASVLITAHTPGRLKIAVNELLLFIHQQRGKITNIYMNHETMKRKGFIPYGPSRAGAESLSMIMTEDLRSENVDVNILLPGGATETGMIRDEMKQSLPANFTLLSPEIIAEPILFLASDQSNGITGQRIIATQFHEWKQKLNY